MAVPFGHRLRPVRATDLDRLLVADPDLDPPAARRWLARALAEHEAGSARTDVLVDADETAVLGRVRTAAEGVSVWIVAECRGTDLESAVVELVSGRAGRSGTHWG